MNWNQARIPVMLLAIIAATVASLFYVYEPGHGYKGKLGLDLQSGSRIVVELKPPVDHPDMQITETDVQRTKQIFEKRLNPMGNKEVVITNEGLRRIIIELPQETDVRRAEDQVRKVGRLDFREEKLDPTTGITKWSTVMGGEYIKDADYRISDGHPEITFELTSEGTTIFGQLTERMVNKKLGIFFDNVEIDSPYVKEPITTGSGRISGGSMTVDQAKEMANFLKAGALPVRIDILASMVVSASLGAEAAQKSFWAGMIGLGLVMIFMLFYYRVPGLLANVALLVYSTLALATMVALGFVLTLPGIAGFILSIGMAVDANVLIFERLKEELWSDKSLRSAVDIGFKRAFSSILDSHVTTFLGALVLYHFAGGTIKGFGYTLMIGTAWSMITAVFFTRVFMDAVVNTGLVTNRKAYGV